MIQTVIEMMSHVFIQRAVLVGTLVSLCAALLGVSLVLKRYSMIGDGLSHVGFGILTIATACGFTSPLYIAIPVVTISAIILLKDGLAGVDIRYNGEYPEENTWVEVVGVVREDTVLGEVIPAIEVTSIEKTETGTTFVTN